MSSIPQQILLQLFLIFLNAFFAMTEIAVISLSPAKLRKMEESGDKKAKKLLKLVDEPAGFLSTIQIGITLAGFLGSAFAADNFSEYLVNWVYVDLGFTFFSPETLDTLAVIVITIILSYFTLVLGELVPKRIAMQRPMEVAKIASGVVSVLAVIMKPVIFLLSVSTNGLLRLLGMKTEAEEETVTEEEIRMMVDLGEENGTIDSDEREWIDNVFDFGETAVRESMTHASDIIGIYIGSGNDEVLKTIKESGLSRFPVYDKNIDDILGILNAREFLINMNSHTPKPLKELVRPAYFVPETISASTLFKDMQKKKIHIAVVIDEYGETSGIVTMEDLLEEIVGNIYDEFDRSEPEEIIKIDDNTWRISGGTYIDTINEELGTDIPENADFDTLGGMIYSCLHTIPKDGSVLSISAYGLEIKVEEVKDRRIETATVRKISQITGEDKKLDIAEE